MGPLVRNNGQPGASVGAKMTSQARAQGGLSSMVELLCDYTATDAQQEAVCKKIASICTVGPQRNTLVQDALLAEGALPASCVVDEQNSCVPRATLTGIAGCYIWLPWGRRDGGRPGGKLGGGGGEVLAALTTLVTISVCRYIFMGTACGVDRCTGAVESLVHVAGGTTNDRLRALAVIALNCACEQHSASKYAACQAGALDLLVECLRSGSRRCQEAASTVLIHITDGNLQLEVTADPDSFPYPLPRSPLLPLVSLSPLPYSHSNSRPLPQSISLHAYLSPTGLNPSLALPYFPSTSPFAVALAADSPPSPSPKSPFAHSAVLLCAEQLSGVRSMHSPESIGLQYCGKCPTCANMRWLCPRGIP